MGADGQDPQRWAKSAVHLKSFSRPTVVSLSCMVNEMSSGKALGERERHLIVAETIGLPLVWRRRDRSRDCYYFIGTSEAVLRTCIGLVYACNPPCKHDANTACSHAITMQVRCMRACIITGISLHALLHRSCTRKPEISVSPIYMYAGWMNSECMFVCEMLVLLLV